MKQKRRFAAQESTVKRELRNTMNKIMVKQKNPIKVKMGQRSKAQGGAFELRTRKDLEEKGWICSKWQNQVEFYKVEDGLKYCFLKAKLIPAKPKMVFNPIIKRMMPQQIHSGFPDFVCFRKINVGFNYEVIGVESKISGELDKEEKLKCRWYLDNGIFNKILVARKTKVKNKVVVEYEDFVDIEKRMKNGKK
ncbi:MAG: hypothetical protein ACTSQL_01040 [Promethearchaeota archaeon]